MLVPGILEMATRKNSGGRPKKLPTINVYEADSVDISALKQKLRRERIGSRVLSIAEIFHEYCMPAIHARLDKLAGKPAHPETGGTGIDELRSSINVRPADRAAFKRLAQLTGLDYPDLYREVCAPVIRRALDGA